MLARAWAAGAGPGDSPLITWDAVDWPGSAHGYTGARGYHPLLAIKVLMWLRANTARGADLERDGGARGVRADSGFYAHTVVEPAGMDVRFSITIRSAPACGT